MRSVIKTASKAAYNAWVDKMTRNQDDETIVIYQRIAYFDPGSRDAFTHSWDDLLTLLRPLHETIFGVQEAGVDTLLVPTTFYHLYDFAFLNYVFY